MTDVITQAQDLIRRVADVADPEAEMRALQRQASPEDRKLFPMLWEGLASAMAMQDFLREGGGQ